MIPDWIKTDVYNKVIELQELIVSRKQEGTIILSRKQAYLQNNEEFYEVLFRKEKKDRTQIIIKNNDKYWDLLCFKIDPIPKILVPFATDDNINDKLAKVIQRLN